MLTLKHDLIALKVELPFNCKKTFRTKCWNTSFLKDNFTKKGKSPFLSYVIYLEFYLNISYVELIQ